MAPRVSVQAPTVEVEGGPIGPPSTLAIVSNSELAAQLDRVEAELARLVAIAEVLAASAGQVTAQLSKGGLGGIMGLLVGKG